MALMKRGVSQGGVDKQNVLCQNFIFLKSLAQLHVEELQPLLKENREYFLATKALTQVPKVQASSEVGHLGVWSPMKPWNFANLVSLKWQFLHFQSTSFLWYSIRISLLSQISYAQITKFPYPWCSAAPALHMRELHSKLNVHKT